MKEFPNPALRVLVAAPRPLSLPNVPGRGGVEAVYEAIEAQGSQMEAEWLWPATYNVLVERLADLEAPDVDVLYLSIVVSESDEGLAFHFEGAGDEADLVSVDKLGAWCSEADLPLLMLQPVEKDKGVEEAIHEHIMELASYCSLNVILLSGRMSLQTLTTATTDLFAALLAKEPLEHAVAGAQHAQGSVNAIKLFSAQRDTPLVRATGEASGGVSKIIRFPEGGLQPAWRSLPSASEVGGLPPEPDHTFVGRGEELARLEGALREESEGGPLWLCGYEGMGKTTLAAHAARWLVRTGRFERVVYTNFQGGGLSEWPLHNLGKCLVDDGFAPGDKGALEAVEEALAETATLVLWDNVEAVLPGGAFALEPEERANLFHLAKRVGGHQRCALCILSDTPDVPKEARALGPLSFTLYLGPLGGEDGLCLLDILMGEPRGGEAGDSQLAALVDVLAGHPLALCVLGSLLRNYDIEQMMAGLEEIMPGVHEGEAHLRNGAIILALEYLMRSFDQEVRYKLSGLGLFAGGLVDFLAPRILDLEQETWEQNRRTLGSAQLLRTRVLEGINVPFVRLHSALTHHLARQLGSQQREKLEERYYGSYWGLLKWLTERENEYVDAARTLARHELPNFRRGFRRILETGNLNAAMTYMHYLQHFLHFLDLPAERDAVAKQFAQAASEKVPAEGPLNRSAFQFLLGQSERLLQSGRISEAGSLLQQLVQRISEEDGLSYGGEAAALDRAAALHRFGQLLQSTQQVKGAYGAYRRALESLEGVEGSEVAQSERVALYEASAQVLLGAGQPQEAEESCRSGLEIAQALDDRGAMGALNAQLANIALMQEKPDKARANLETALIHFRAAGDKLNMARAWDRLGGVARQTSDLEEAQRCYEQALEVAREADNAAYEAQMLLRLAQLAAEQGETQRAETHYQNAIEIYEEHDQRAPLIASQMKLAEFLLRQGELEEARERAEAARRVAEDLGPRFNPWEIYVLLQRIAEAREDLGAEGEWRRRAREAFARSPQAEAVRRRWSGLIDGVARSARGEALDAERVKTIEELEANDEWQRLAQAIWRILGGERGDTVYKELDHIEGAIIQGILEAIEHPPREREEGDEGF
ncbi:MAG: tetratricopeptide repeat protein [Chloroflexota bacterium]|nr:tetratricopeptide repeat protein [Chloroflexota bacterium]